MKTYIWTLCLLLCPCEGKTKLLFQRPKIEEDLENAAEAFPHTGLAHAATLPVDSEGASSLEGEA